MSFTLTPPAGVPTLLYLGYRNNVDFRAGDLGNGDIFVEWLQGAEPTAASVQATAATVSGPTALARLEKAAAKADLDSGDTQTGVGRNRILIAVVQLMLDEFNRHGTFESQLLAAIAAANSLANLQTRVAAISAVPQRTKAQLVAAVKAAIDGTPE